MTEEAKFWIMCWANWLDNFKNLDTKYMKTSIKLFAIFCLFGLLASCSDDDDGQEVGPLVYPTFSQNSGTYNNGISVEIGSNVENANIYYTIDGTLPSVSSTAYSGPIAISSNTDLKAISISEADGTSEISGVSYSFKTATPKVSVDPGNIEFSQFVTLSSGTEGADIYYTLDGSDPDMDDIAYDGTPIWVDVDFNKLKAVAFSTFDKSDVLTAEYTIVLKPLVSIYWYAAAGDQVPGVGGSNPFLPYDMAVNNYTLTLNTNTVLDTIPLNHDVLVMADTYSENFDLSDFQGRVIVTYNRSVEAFMADILERDTEGESWDYGISPMLTWVNPEDWGTETIEVGSSYLMSDIIDDDAADVMFVKRGDIIQGTVPSGDAVIVYEVSKGDRKWYWVHIGAFDSRDPSRASEVLKYTLDVLTGN